MLKIAILGTFAAAILAGAAFGQGWDRTKNIADDLIYDGQNATLYCGCPYVSHEDRDGSGDVVYEDEQGASVCGFAATSSRSMRVEWEHIVPASLMPAREFDCWNVGDDAGRDNCERLDPRAQAMMFDLHNLAPSIGSVNGRRSNHRYGELPDDASDFGRCEIEDAGGIFEPPACTRGDVARVWFYMNLVHGVAISAEERIMFEQWSLADPVSPWESERETRIAAYSRINNPFVDGIAPSDAGACPWEPGGTQ